MVRELFGSSWQTPSRLSCVFFTEEWLPSGHSTIKAWLVECCRDGRTFQKDNHLHSRTLELCQRNYWVLGYLLDQGPSPMIIQYSWAASSRKSHGGSRHLPFKNDGGHCILGDLQCCRIFLVPFPRSVPRYNPVSVLYGQFLRTHGLTSTVNFGTLYRQVCAFPNHVQSIEFSTGGLQSSCGNISRMNNGNRMHLCSISCLIAKGLNTYVTKFVCFLQKILKTCFRFVILGYCV